MDDLAPPYGATLPQAVFEQYQRQTALPQCHLAAAGYFHHLPTHHIRRRGIRDTILLYCVGGRGQLRLSRRWTAKAGDLILIPAGTPHEYGSDPLDPWAIHWAHFQGSSSGILLSRLGVSAQKPILPIGHAPYVLAQFDQIREALSKGYSLPNLDFASAALLSILTSLQRSPGTPAHAESASRFDCNAVIDLMRQTLASPLALDNLASRFNLTPWHFSRRFKAATGFAPMDYFIRLKMQRACEMLSTSTRDIRLLAQELGYEDPLYFSRLFRRVNGVSPSAFRARYSQVR